MRIYAYILPRLPGFVNRAVRWLPADAHRLIFSCLDLVTLLICVSVIFLAGALSNKTHLLSMLGADKSPFAFVCVEGKCSIQRRDVQWH